jgi:hypothetical protein
MLVLFNATNVKRTRIARATIILNQSAAVVISIIQEAILSEVARTAAIRVCITIAQATVIVAIHQCVAVLTNVSTRVVQDVQKIQTAIQAEAMSVARRHFLPIKLCVLRIVLTKLATRTTTVLGMESVADRESVLTQVVATSVSRIQSVVQINIVAGRQTQAGERLVVLKLVLASYVARARTAGQPMNAVFLTNVLIRVARDVQQTQTAVPDSIVVRKNSGMS